MFRWVENNQPKASRERRIMKDKLTNQQVKNKRNISIMIGTSAFTFRLADSQTVVLLASLCPSFSNTSKMLKYLRVRPRCTLYFFCSRERGGGGGFTTTLNCHIDNSNTRSMNIIIRKSNNLNKHQHLWSTDTYRGRRVHAQRTRQIFKGDTSETQRGHGRGTAGVKYAIFFIFLELMCLTSNIMD